MDSEEAHPEMRLMDSTEQDRIPASFRAIGLLCVDIKGSFLFSCSFYHSNNPGKENTRLMNGSVVESGADGGKEGWRYVKAGSWKRVQRWWLHPWGMIEFQTYLPHWLGAVITMVCRENLHIQSAVINSETGAVLHQSPLFAIGEPILIIVNSRYWFSEDNERIIRSISLFSSS